MSVYVHTLASTSICVCPRTSKISVTSNIHQLAAAPQLSAGAFEIRASAPREQCARKPGLGAGRRGQGGRTREETHCQFCRHHLKLPRSAAGQLEAPDLIGNCNQKPKAPSRNPWTRRWSLRRESCKVTRLTFEMLGRTWDSTLFPWDRRALLEPDKHGHCSLGDNSCLSFFPALLRQRGWSFSPERCCQRLFRGHPSRWVQLSTRAHNGSSSAVSSRAYLSLSCEIGSLLIRQCVGRRCTYLLVAAADLHVRQNQQAARDMPAVRSASLRCLSINVGSEVMVQNLFWAAQRWMLRESVPFSHASS